MASEKRKQWSVVIMSTLAFTVCFMVWMMFAVIGIPIKTTLQLNETQFGILVAMPVLTGSLIRLPLGMLTDRYGGRIVFAVLMVSTVVPIYLISHGTAFWLRIPGKLDTHSSANWTPIPRQSGHRFQSKLDSDSRPIWTVGA